MKGASRLILGATLVMGVSLVLVLGLIIVLLAELYCTLLLRRRQHRRFDRRFDISNTASSADATEVTVTTTTRNNLHQSQTQSSTAPSLSSFYAQGVLSAPRSILFPAVSDKTELLDVEKQHSTTQLQLESLTRKPKSEAGLVSTSPSSPTFTQLVSPKQVEKASFQSGSTGGNFGEHLVYISNPIYDDEGGRLSRAEDNTPFETPDSSPSRLETGGSSEDDDDDEREKLSLTSSPSTLAVTPPLTPMKKLPAEACSVSLRDARSLGTSGSDSNTNIGVSSSSSGTPCTSPSW